MSTPLDATTDLSQESGDATKEIGGLNVTMTDVVESRRQTEALLDEINLETKQQALTSELKALSSLEAQYKNSDDANGDNHFLSGLKSLQERYQSIRTIRGDGNCYYRAFLYRLLEQVAVPKAPEGKRLLDYFQTVSWENILRQGYDEMALEIFHDEIVELVHGVVPGGARPANDTAATAVPNMTLADFHTAMNQENGVSDYCTWYLRVVTAAHLKHDPVRFEPYIWDAQTQSGDQDGILLDMAQFCAKYIEPMGQECEHLQVLALAEAVGVHVHIEYLDGRPNSAMQVQCHSFGPDTAATKLHLLYRPGHYDILYPKEVTP